MTHVSIINKLNKQDWPSVIKECTLHSVNQLRYYGLWNRRGLKGYSAHDITMEAIEKVYVGEWAWNPAKSELTNYLKFHVIRGLIANLAKSSEVVSTSDTEVSEADWLATDADLEDDIIKSQLIQKIQETIADEEVLIVFKALLRGDKRNDICEDNNWEHKVYDNASRRLNDHIRKITNDA